MVSSRSDVVMPARGVRPHFRCLQQHADETGRVGSEASARPRSAVVRARMLPLQQQPEGGPHHPTDRRRVNPSFPQHPISPPTSRAVSAAERATAAADNN